MAYGIAYGKAIQAQNIDALNRTAVGTVDVENGSVFNLATQEANSERWNATIPTTGSLSNLWMAMTPEVVVVKTASGKSYKGISPDPRDFINYIGDSIDAIKPMVDDIIHMSADAVAGTKAANTFVVATNNAYKLTWAATAVAGLSLKLVAQDDMVIATGAIGLLANRVTAYKFEVEAIA
jgi:frataxin-like iron-binding protein CyaY